MPVKKISSSEIERGMYISSLDRPWTETPFLFQGFEVRNQEEIDELQQLTRHVFIMVPDEEIELKKISGNSRGALQAHDKLHKVTYQTIVSAHDEIKAKREAHENISHLFAEIDALVQKQSGLQLKDLEEPVSIMVDSVIKNPDAYLWLTRIKKYDSFVYRDSLSAAVWATALGRQMGMNEHDLHTLALGCMLMDVGKLALPAELLNKPGRLTSAEWEQMKKHVELGVSILEEDPHCSPDVLDAVRTHHERLDGSGYTQGLHGSQIPLFGQLAGIVDFYIAVTTQRPFAEAISPSMAQKMLYDQKDRYFDGMLVDYFIQALSTYPTGSLVELSSGEVAVVIAQNPSLRLKPDVVLLLDSNKQLYQSYTVVSLANYHDNDIPVVIVKTLEEGAHGLKIEKLAL